MSDYIDELVDSLSDKQVMELLTSRRTRIRPRRYRSVTQDSTSEKLPVSEEFIRAIEAEGDIDAVTRKFINKMKRQAGATKETSEDYLGRVLDKALKEGRL